MDEFDDGNETLGILLSVINAEKNPVESECEKGTAEKLCSPGWVSPTADDEVDSFLRGV